MNATDLMMPVLGGGRVLVVDEDDDSAAALTAMLRLHGFDARAARSRSEALAAVQKYGPHAVVLDPNGTDPDWRKTARRLQSANAAPALVILTGDTDPTISRAAGELGAAGYFLKPAEPQDLVTLLHHLCHNRAG